MPYFGNKPAFTKQDLPIGDAGTDKTVSAMAAMTRAAAADPTFISFARELSARYGQKANLDVLYGIGKWVRSVWTFRRDPIGMELLVTPQRIVQDIQRTGTHVGDCDEASVLIASILMAIGFIARFVVVQRNPNAKMYDHVFVEVLFNNEWLALDGIAFGRDIFFRSDGVRRKEYQI